MEEAIQETKKSNMQGGRAWAVVFVVFMAGFCMPANMGETMWVAPLVMQAYGFGPDVLGWVNGVFYILGAVIAFPAASFVRRLGIRWSVTIALACGIIGNIIGILAGDVAVLMVSRIIQGAGFGLMGVIGVTAITPWFPKARRGLPLGIWGAWVATANAVTPIIDGAVAEATGTFISVWWMLLALDIIVLVTFLIVYRDPSDPYIDEAGKSGEVSFSYKELFSNRVVWVLAFVFFIEEGAFIASQGFLSAYVMEYLDAPLIVGTGLVSAGAFWGMCFSPIAGKISDAIKSRRKVLIFCMVSAVIFGANGVLHHRPVRVYHRHRPEWLYRWRCRGHALGLVLRGRALAPHLRCYGGACLLAERWHVPRFHVHGQRHCGCGLYDGGLVRTRAVLRPWPAGRHLRSAWQAEIRQNCPGDFCLVLAPPDYRRRLFRIWS